MYGVRIIDNYYYVNEYLEWVTFDRFTNIKEIGEGRFSKRILQHGLMVN
jgi:hypothetical protein